MTRKLRRLALLVVTTSLLTLAFGTGSAFATPCWQRLINDWWDGRIDNYYSPACVRAAIRHAPNDLREYSDLPTDLRRMLQGPLVKAGKHHEVLAAGARGRNGGGRSTSSVDPASTATSTSTTPAKRDAQGYAPASSRASGPIPRAIRSTDGNPSSLPIPLLALGGLALLLLASGATGLITRRLRGRRAGGGPPAPGG